jgi:hypothetical protein
MIRMWAAVLVLAFVSATSASVNITFQNHSHVVVTADTGVYTYDLGVDDDVTAFVLSAAPVLRTYGQMT